MLTDQQIEVMVYQKYPKEKRELNCRQYRVVMEDKRAWYRQQLIANKELAPTLN